jgi:hypothetical protein
MTAVPPASLALKTVMSMRPTPKKNSDSKSNTQEMKNVKPEKEEGQRRKNKLNTMKNKRK